MKENNNKITRKIAIDLSTTNIGVCFEYENKELYLNQVKLKPYSMENLGWNVDYLTRFFEKIASFHILKNENWEEYKIILGIELSNFCNPLFTGRFNLYAGVIISAFHKIIDYKCLEIKLFNSNEWQKMIGCVNSDKRETRKIKARDWAIGHGIKDGLSEDEYDAFCIWHQLGNIHTTEQIKEEKKSKSKSKNKYQSMNNTYKNMIINRLEKIGKLDPIRNQEQIKRLKSEIKVIEEKIKELKEKLNE